jgi:hypothetical protein
MLCASIQLGTLKQKLLVKVGSRLVIMDLDKPSNLKIFELFMKDYTIVEAFEWVF